MQIMTKAVNPTPPAAVPATKATADSGKVLSCHNACCNNELYDQLYCIIAHEYVPLPPSLRPWKEVITENASSSVVTFVMSVEVS